VKLPPRALTAPTLCPRCDAPATILSQCIQCALPLRQCGACRGTAGPFDRHCGFCGFELLRGTKRGPAWRLWLLAALIPLAAALAVGIWGSGLQDHLLGRHQPPTQRAASAPATGFYQAPQLTGEYRLALTRATPPT